MMSQGNYTNEFYKKQSVGSLQSAEHVVPKILKLIPATSIIDVGCGIGTWLHAFEKAGVENITGIDGNYVDRKMLQIPQENFIPHDLSQPLDINKISDLVISLEVAEHLDEKFAKGFIENLTRLGPAIVFSAAVPDQGGTHHVNEQWPSYWINIFKEYDYVAIDAIRDLIWDNNDIATHYIQNIIIFVAKDRLSDYPQLQKIYQTTKGVVQNKIHPKLWITKNKRYKKRLNKRLSLRLKNIFGLS